MDNQAHLKTWNVYQSAWGPIDEQERRRLLKMSVADDILYTDPVSQVRGLEKLVAHRPIPGEVCGRLFQERQLP